MVKYKNFGANASFVSPSLHPQHSTRTTTTAHRSADREGEETICSNVGTTVMEDNDSSHHRGSSYSYSASETSNPRKTKRLSYVGYVPFQYHSHQNSNYHHPLDNDNTSHTGDSHSYATGTTGTKSTCGMLALRIDDTSTSRRQRGAGSASASGLSDIIPENDRRHVVDEIDDDQSPQAQEDERDDADAGGRLPATRTPYSVGEPDADTTANAFRGRDAASSMAVLQKSEWTSSIKPQGSTDEAYVPITTPAPTSPSSQTIRMDNKGNNVYEKSHGPVLDSRILRRQRLAMKYTSNEIPSVAADDGTNTDTNHAEPQNLSTAAIAPFSIVPTHPLSAEMEPNEGHPKIANPVSPRPSQQPQQQKQKRHHPLSPVSNPPARLTDAGNNGGGMSSPPTSPVTPNGSRGSRLARILRKTKLQSQAAEVEPTAKGTTVTTLPGYSKPEVEQVEASPSVGISPNHRWVHHQPDKVQENIGDDEPARRHHLTPRRVVSSSSEQQPPTSPASYSAVMSRPSVLGVGRRVQSFPDEMTPPSLDLGCPYELRRQDQRRFRLNHPMRMHQQLFQEDQHQLRMLHLQQQQQQQQQRQIHYQLNDQYHNDFKQQQMQQQNKYHQQINQMENARLYYDSLNRSNQSFLHQPIHPYHNGSQELADERSRVTTAGVHQHNTMYYHHAYHHQPHQPRQQYQHHQEFQDSVTSPNQDRMTPVVEENSDGSFLPDVLLASSEWTTEDNQPFLMCGPDGPRLKNVRFVTPDAQAASAITEQAIANCEPVSLKCKDLMATVVSACSAIAGKGYHTDSKKAQFEKVAEDSISALTRLSATGQLDVATRRDFANATFLIGSQWQNYSSYFGGKTGGSFVDNENESLVAPKVPSSSSSGHASLDGEGGSSHTRGSASIGTKTADTMQEDSFAANARRFFQAGNDIIGSLPLSDLQQHFAGGIEQSNPKMIKDVKNLFDAFQRYYEPDEIIYEDEPNDAKLRPEPSNEKRESTGACSLINEYKMHSMSQIEDPEEENEPYSEAIADKNDVEWTLQEKLLEDEKTEGTAISRLDITVGLRQRRRQKNYSSFGSTSRPNEDAEIERSTLPEGRDNASNTPSESWPTSTDGSSSLSPVERQSPVMAPRVQPETLPPQKGDDDSTKLSLASIKRAPVDYSTDTARLNRIYRNLHLKINREEAMPNSSDAVAGNASPIMKTKDDMMDQESIPNPSVVKSSILQQEAGPQNIRTVKLSFASVDRPVGDAVSDDSADFKDAAETEQSSDEEFEDADEMQSPSSVETLVGESENNQNLAHSGPYEASFDSYAPPATTEPSLHGIVVDERADEQGISDGRFQTSNSITAQSMRQSENEVTSIQNTCSLRIDSTTKSIDTEELLSVFLATKTIESVDNEDIPFSNTKLHMEEHCSTQMPSPSSSMSDSLVGSDMDDEDVHTDSFLEESPALNVNRSLSPVIHDEYQIPQHDPSDEIRVQEDSHLALKPVLDQQDLDENHESRGFGPADDGDVVLDDSFERSEFPHTPLDVIEEASSEGSLCDREHDAENGSVLSDEESLEGSRVASIKANSVHSGDFVLFSESSKSSHSEMPLANMSSHGAEETWKGKSDQYVEVETISEPTKSISTADSKRQVENSAWILAFGRGVGKLLFVSVAVCLFGLTFNSWTRVYDYAREIYQDGVNQMMMTLSDVHNARTMDANRLFESPDTHDSQSIAAWKDQEMQTLRRLVEDALDHTHSTEAVLVSPMNNGDQVDAESFERVQPATGEIPVIAHPFPLELLPKSNWIIELEEALEAEQKQQLNEVIHQKLNDAGYR